MAREKTATDALMDELRREHDKLLQQVHGKSASVKSQTLASCGSLAEAIHALEGDMVLQEALGEVTCEAFMRATDPGAELARLFA